MAGICLIFYLSGLSLLFSTDHHLFSDIKDRHPILIRYRCLEQVLSDYSYLSHWHLVAEFFLSPIVRKRKDKEGIIVP